MAQAEDPQRDLFFRLETLRQAVLEAGPRVRWALSARLLWNLLRASVEGLRAQLRRAQPGSAVFSDLAGSIESVTDYLHALLGYVEAGLPERVHQAIVPALERIMRCLVPESRVLVCYDWSPSNYAYLSEFPGKLKAIVSRAVLADGVDPEIQKAANAVPGLFAVVFFPAAERHNVLLHAALAHEIGHGLGEYINVRVTTDSSQGLAQRITGLSNADQAALYELYLRWHRELVADAWSVYLMGPAPMMSFQALARETPPTTTHPASHLRFRLMQICLEKTGFVGGEEPVTDMEWLPGLVESAVSGSAGAVSTDDVPHAELAHLWLEHSLQGIASSVYELARDHAYTGDRWESECTLLPSETLRQHQLVRRLLYAIPPDIIENEGEELPASLPSILNAGWTVYVEPQRWGRFCAIFGKDDLDGQFEARRKLQQLLLKSLDSVHIMGEWRRDA